MLPSTTTFLPSCLLLLAPCFNAANVLREASTELGFALYASLIIENGPRCSGCNRPPVQHVAQHHHLPPFLPLASCSLLQRRKRLERSLHGTRIRVVRVVDYRERPTLQRLQPPPGPACCPAPPPSSLLASCFLLLASTPQTS